MNTILLDTHIWIWYANGSPELSKTTRKIINTAAEQHRAHIAAISLWEVSMLEAKERIILDMPCLEWINQSLELIPLRVLPFTPSIAVDSCHLPDAAHDDPADRIIMATARVEKLTLLTRDTRILKYSQKKYLATLKA